ncbi:MAG: TatD family nuclease-associated radical SAM protein [Oscillospiraceae bacterium]|nr:TatD family nuclease-associated radical SAM protein [Oscillospiraceae bacterium]
MIILYVVESNKFINIKDIDKEVFGQVFESVYINITNRCPSSCSFCVRKRDVGRENSLWLEREPGIDEVINEFDLIDISRIKEVVFCGFGEPTERMDVIIAVSKYLKDRNSKLQIRINTNGLGSLINGRSIAEELKGLIDTISISLNSCSSEKYLEITKSKFGIKSFSEMLKFAKECKEYIPNVVLTVVDLISEEEIEQCKEICEEISIPLRIRNCYETKNTD